MNFFGNPHFDLIAIGDTVVDNFIKIKDAEILGKNTERAKICLTFGDKIPYEKDVLVLAVGNSANAAVAASRLGLKTALVSNLGADTNGDLCLKSLKKDSVNTNFIKKHSGKRTNYHYVLWYEDDRTILIKHEEYPYELANIGNPKWIYLSSLGSNSLDFHKTISDYLVSHPDIKLAFQPGTYQIKFGHKKLEKIYQRSNLFFCNKEEAKKILETNSDDLKVLSRGLKELGPEVIFITDGRNGAYVYDQQELWHMPIFPDQKNPVERTGAGDAFSSTVTAGFYLGLNLENSMKWALINSMSVVGKIGAQAGLLTKQEIESFIIKSPAEYKLDKIS